MVFHPPYQALGALAWAPPVVAPMTYRGLVLVMAAPVPIPDRGQLVARIL